jgi:hypothetical protein
MAVETFDAFCPTCNMQVVTRVIAQGHGGFSSAAMNAIDEADAEYHGDHFFVALCTKCASPFLVKQSLYGIPGEFESLTQESILFPVESRLPLERIPEPVKRAYEQALRSYSASLYEPSALMCRRCLEALTKSLGAQGRNLQDKLDSLKTTGHVDSRLVEWAHSIRILGNEAAHDTDVAITKENKGVRPLKSLHSLPVAFYRMAEREQGRGIESEWEKATLQ